MNATPQPVTVTLYSERFINCASCRAAARWIVNGTPTCDRHRATWERRSQTTTESETGQ